MGATIFFTAAMNRALIQRGQVAMVERTWQEPEYRIDVCRVTRGVHIEHI
jgi:hypothetical protein